MPEHKRWGKQHPQRRGAPETSVGLREERRSSRSRAGGDGDPLNLFQPIVGEWFRHTFASPTRPQSLGWPPIARGESTLLLAPTGTGKTLAAFLACIDQILFSPPPPAEARCRVIYISPLKALAVDVEKNLRVPIDGIVQRAQQEGVAVYPPKVFIRTGDTPGPERSRFQRESADILITTPESLYLLLTSAARQRLRAVETVILDEIHALVPSKRGAHLALSLERLQAICGRPLQRIGLSATQRPLDKAALFLGGFSEKSGRAAGGLSEERNEFRSTERVPEKALLRQPNEFDSVTQSGGTSPASVVQRQTSPRPVAIVDAGEKKPLELRVEMPVEEMEPAVRASPPGASKNRPRDLDRPPASDRPTAQTSIWPAIHSQLLQLVRQHRHPDRSPSLGGRRAAAHRARAAPGGRRPPGKDLSQAPRRPARRLPAATRRFPCWSGRARLPMTHCCRYAGGCSGRASGGRVPPAERFGRGAWFHRRQRDAGLWFRIYSARRAPQPSAQPLASGNCWTVTEF